MVCDSLLDSENDCYTYVYYCSFEKVRVIIFLLLTSNVRFLGLLMSCPHNYIQTVGPSCCPLRFFQKY